MMVLDALKHHAATFVGALPYLLIFTPGISFMLFGFSGHLPVAYGFLGIGLFVVPLAWMLREGKKWTKRMCAERAHVSLEEFKRLLAGKDYEPEAIEETYKTMLGDGGIPPLPSDDLEETLHIDYEDIEDYANAAFKKYRWDEDALPPGSPDVPLKTVEDYVQLISALVRHYRRLGDQRANFKIPVTRTA